MSYSVKPQMRTLGPKYGKLLGAIGAHLKGEGVGDAVVAATRNGGVYTVELNGTAVELTEADILVSTRQKAGLVSASDKGVTVVIDTNLNDALIEEGFMREIVSKVQTMRKDADFEVTDHIFVAIRGSKKIGAILEKYGDEILSDVLGDGFVPAIMDGFIKEWNINGEDVTVTICKAY